MIKNLKTKICINLRQLVYLTLLLATSVSFAEGNSGGVGGGNSQNSIRLNKIRQYNSFKTNLENDLFSLRLHLTSFLDLVYRFRKTTSLSNYVSEMVDKGIKDSIKNAEYELSYECYEDQIIQGSKQKVLVEASTTNINNTNLRQPIFPKICINVPLIFENSHGIYDRIQIASLLIHEHSRHYGYEDKDPRTKFQPSSYFIETKKLLFDAISNNSLFNIENLINPEPLLWMNLIFPTEETKSSNVLNVSESYLMYNLTEEIFNSFKNFKIHFYSLSKSCSYQEYEYQPGQTEIKLSIDNHMFKISNTDNLLTIDMKILRSKNRRFAIFRKLSDEPCQLKYKITIDDAESLIINQKVELIFRPFSFIPTDEEDLFDIIPIEGIDQ